MTTCVVEFTILIPEFPGGCGGKKWNVRKDEEGEGERLRGWLFLGKKEGGKEKERKEKRKKTSYSHKLIHLSQIPKCSLNPHPAVRSNQST